MAPIAYRCGGCGGEFVTLQAAEEISGEAGSVFAADELVDQAIVCDDCWKAMRADLPGLDARYAEAGL